MSDDLTPKEVEDQARKVNEWLQSDEGKAAMRQVSEKSRQRRLERERKRREFMGKRFWIGG